MALAGAAGDVVDGDLVVGAEGDGDLVLRHHAAGGFNEQGATDAAQHAAPGRCGAAGGEAVPVRGCGGAVEQGRVVAAVVHGRHGAAGGQGVGEGFGRQRVEAAQRQAIRAETDGGLVHQALHGIGHVRPAGATIGGDGDGVGQRQAVAAVHGGDAVAARAHHGGVERGDQGAGGDRVGAEVRDPVMPDAEEAARRVQRQLGVHADAAAMVVAEERLRPRGDPLDRGAAAQGGEGQRCVLGIGGPADAEAAAHVLRTDADPFGGQARQPGQAVAQRDHALRAGPEVERVPVPAGQG